MNIYSYVLAEFLQGNKFQGKVEKCPSEWKYHLQTLIKFLVPLSSEYSTYSVGWWWEYDNETDVYKRLK